MLARFSVQNFLSFKTAQTLDLVANNRHAECLDDNAFETENSLFPEILKTAAIFGPNASGKSNLLKALQTLQLLVIRKEVVGPNPIHLAVPFLFQENRDDPVIFEVQLLLDGIAYEYTLAVRHAFVHLEALKVHGGPKRKWRTIFMRKAKGEQPADGFDYSYGSDFVGPRKVIEKATSPDSTFLGTAPFFEVQALAPVYRWFKEQLIVINERTSLNHLFTIEKMATTPAIKDAVLRLMRSADLGISGIEITRQKVPTQQIHFDPLKGEAEVRNSEQETYVVHFQHSVHGQNWMLPFSEESMGTRRFLHLAGPIIDLLQKETALLFDELENSLHPHLLEAIVQAFQSEPHQRRGSQLIFTTHCDSLLDNKTTQPDTPLLRRDQIWFVDKNRDMESSLYCLDEFKTVRKAESIRKGYRSGRYDAIPFIDSLSLPQEPL